MIPQRKPRKNRSQRTRNQDTVTLSRFVPQRNYLSSHVAGVSQHITRTLAWSVFNASAIVTSNYTEPTVVTVNSAYDPDAAIGGGYPTGFVKYMALYSKCFVRAARIKVRGAAVPASGNSELIVGLTITTNTTALGGVNYAITAGLTDYVVMNTNPDRFNLNGSVDVAKFLDKPRLLDDPQLFSTASAGPGQVICAHLWVWNFSASTTTINYVIELEQDVVFTDPIPFS